MKTTAFGLTLLLASLGAFAQEKAAIQACRALTDTGARLACYDAIELTPPKAPMAPVAAAAPAPAAKPAANFGLAPKPAPEAASDQVESTIPGNFEGWEPHTSFKLANGQVWQIDDGSRASYSLQSPAVKIKRGLFGSFNLEIAGANRTPKVKRVQ